MRRWFDCYASYTIISRQPCNWLFLSLCPSVCLYVCVQSTFKQYISKTSLWIFAKFVTETPYILPWKWLTSGTNHIQDGWERMAQNLQFSYWQFPKRRNRPSCSESHYTIVDHHVYMIADHDGWWAPLWVLLQGYE